MSLSILTPGPQMLAELSGELTVAQAAEVRDALALALTTSEQLTLDLGGLEEIDVAGLQVLLALASEPHPVHFTNPSPFLLRLAGLLQLEPLQQRFSTN
ncbi:MAG: anti-anti-sigma factor [Candidatus Dactylopiibacterium carminicum]|uniref:Anti-anti-sigma factor n=1 Tax=Candidatus Dactylopiibacterium carminicum TaxID=857335 RepID=A0A272EUK8_9RHOO|nr:STAS domain-containing protein [Candidatus Dactylopiibacterium carminicum]KAF7600382.1 STAS domain-containing protein [Candidatus Dactylopiibacterium carminicum]PAS93789.1 MAG: anti-anti-sigma factor [Candidatus Dactylopiibacterium carminicum]PAS96827.1 MAG: anti-anti-sigma factor [Candidatus Dactylopiibacterium carminicum]PAT00382.1 MAG: hypothetical protein BSR46_03130 [Candidatus Dactylopiibacterium carminicum]